MNDNTEKIMLGHMIRQRRKDLGWSVEEAAQKVKETVEIVKRIEKGQYEHYEEYWYYMRMLGGLIKIEWVDKPARPKKKPR